MAHKKKTTDFREGDTGTVFQRGGKKLGCFQNENLNAAADALTEKHSNAYTKNQAGEQKSSARKNDAVKQGRKPSRHGKFAGLGAEEHREVEDLKENTSPTGTMTPERASRGSRKNASGKTKQAAGQGESSSRSEDSLSSLHMSPLTESTRLSFNGSEDALSAQLLRTLVINDDVETSCSSDDDSYRQLGIRPTTLANITLLVKDSPTPRSSGISSVPVYCVDSDSENSAVDRKFISGEENYRTIVEDSLTEETADVEGEHLSSLESSTEVNCDFDGNGKKHDKEDLEVTEPRRKCTTVSNDKDDSGSFYEVEDRAVQVSLMSPGQNVRVCDMESKQWCQANFFLELNDSDNLSHSEVHLTKGTAHRSEQEENSGEVSAGRQAPCLTSDGDANEPEDTAEDFDVSVPDMSTPDVSLQASFSTPDCRVEEAGVFQQETSESETASASRSGGREPETDRESESCRDETAGENDDGSRSSETDGDSESCRDENAGEEDDDSTNSETGRESESCRDEDAGEDDDDSSRNSETDSESESFRDEDAGEDDDDSSRNSGTDRESESFRDEDAGEEDDSDTHSEHSEADSVRGAESLREEESSQGVGAERSRSVFWQGRAVSLEDSLPDLDPSPLENDRYCITVPSVSTKKAQSSDSSDNDEELEAFFQKMKTPHKPRKVETKDLDNFIVEDWDVSESGDSASEDEDDDDCIFSVPDLPPPSRPRVRRKCTLPQPRSYNDDKDSDSKSSADETASSSSVDSSRTWMPESLHAGVYGELSSTSGAAGTTSTLGEDTSLPHDGAVGYVTPSKPSVPAKTYRESSVSTPASYGFLKSLSDQTPHHQRHPEAQRFVKKFTKTREELVKSLFLLYNKTVFEFKLPKDLPIIWNKRLLRTAGYCVYKRGPQGPTARVELSTKVCDTAERTRDTLIHELCHTAVWLLNGVNDGHGPHWKYWSKKANSVYPEIPVIRRCHDYSVNTKYIYECSMCGYRIGRHSKSLDVTKKCCGHCHGRFQLKLASNSSESGEARTPRTPNKFALFVQANYSAIKKERSSLRHKEIMQVLSKEFASKTRIGASATSQ